ncbi:MAG: hypothetical protein GY788_12925 [bacterium]|nr:hypothetical protein [bacterium]
MSGSCLAAMRTLGIAMMTFGLALAALAGNAIYLYLTDGPFLAGTDSSFGDPVLCARDSSCDRPRAGSVG